METQIEINRIQKRERTRDYILFAAVSVFTAGMFYFSSAHAQTFNESVADIIYQNCTTCHRTGGIGPMSFSSYDEIRPWAPLIAHKVATREMPPYAYDAGIGRQNLQGDWRLSEEDIDTIISWAAQGAVKGPGESPTPPSYTDGWNFESDLGPPDLIIPSIAMDIPANGNDLWSKHYVPSTLTEDRCIKAVQVKPRGEAQSVVHHANSYIEIDGERYGQLTEYAMGKWGELIPEGTCRLIPANSDIAWDIHMYPGGIRGGDTVVEDNVVEIGLWFEESTPDSLFRQDLKLYPLRNGYENGHLIIPPNGYTMTQGFHSFDHDVRIDSFQPHGHLRMNAASLEIYHPFNGNTEVISQISNWSATWHHSHIYDGGVFLPAGSVMIIKQWYDNTSANPNNPDPDQWVYGGSRTGDEMSHAWIGITHFGG